jgi:hypothetical protein
MEVGDSFIRTAAFRLDFDTEAGEEPVGPATHAPKGAPGQLLPLLPMVF